MQGAVPGADRGETRAERLSFGRLYDRYAPRVRLQLRRLGVDPMRIDDVAQEVWLTVHRRLQYFDGRSRIATWLYGIELNVVRHERRHLRRRPLPEDSSPDIPAGARFDPEVMRSGRETWRALSTFAAGLGSSDRELLASVLLEGCSAEEAARQGGLDVRRVYQRSRALRKALLGNLNAD